MNKITASIKLDYYHQFPGTSNTMLVDVSLPTFSTHIKECKCDCNQEWFACYRMVVVVCVVFFVLEIL